MKREQVGSRDPDVVSGALVFAGTRIPVEILIDYLKAGDSLDRFVEGFPTVTRRQAEAFLEMALEAIKAEMDETLEGLKPKGFEIPQPSSSSAYIEVAET